MSRAPGGPRFHGFDPLRVGLAAAVVAWHVNLTGPSALFDPAAFRRYTVTPGDLLGFQVLCLAVPLFFLVSFFLHVVRNPSRGSLRRRLGQIFALYSFWMTITVLAQGGIPYARQVLASDWMTLAGFAITGGGTHFYFFFSLGLLTLVAELAKGLRRRWVGLLFVGSVLLMVLQQATALRVAGAGFATGYANPLNFLPYVFLAILLVHPVRRGSAGPPWAWVGVAVAASIAAAVLEWKLLPSTAHFAFNRAAFPVYTRPSLVAGALAVFLAALRVDRPAPAWVRWLGDRSLGLYCLHPFVVTILYLGWPPLRGLGDRLVFFVAVWTLSLLSAEVVRRALSHRLV